MSRRYTKTKAAGQLVGLTREYKPFRQQAHMIGANNRQMRRMRVRERKDI